jgi:hypothetical protein
MVKLMGARPSPAPGFLGQQDRCRALRGAASGEGAAPAIKFGSCRRVGKFPKDLADPRGGENLNSFIALKKCLVQVSARDACRMRASAPMRAAMRIIVAISSELGRV